MPLRFVDHTYHDYSRYLEQGGKLIKHKKSTNKFPARLHRMLSNEEHSDVICWMVRQALGVEDVLYCVVYDVCAHLDCSSS